jgi:hypothetical protein
MKKTLFAALAMIMLVGVAIVLPLSTAHAGFETFLAETETRLYKPEKSYNGYFQTVPGNNVGGGTVYLMDLWGNVYHSWVTKGGAPRLQADGTLWSIFYIQDWDGNVLWDYDPVRDSGETFTCDHDQRKMWNKDLKQWTSLICCNRNLTSQEALDAGVDPAIVAKPGTRLNQFNFVIEVNMAKQIVWRWNQWDHACQTVNPAWPNYVSDPKDVPGKDDWGHMTDTQLPNGQAGVVADYHHVNTVDYNEDTGHVSMSEKSWGQFVVVDHDKTFVSTTDFSKNIAAAKGPDGDRIYRFGIPESYNRGVPKGVMTEGTQQLYGQHDTRWIWPYHWEKPHLSTDTWPDPSAYPYGYTKRSQALNGAGNFIIFDNGNYNMTGMRSRAIEVDPRIGASGQPEVPYGQYIPEWVAGWTPIGPAPRISWYKSKQIAWLWSPQSTGTCFCSTQSNVQRLPNGNTHITCGPNGHLFEVMPDGEMVWEYLYPGLGTQMKTVSTDGSKTFLEGMTGGAPGISYRAYRYGEDYPAFTGRDMKSQGTLTGRLPRLVGSTDSYPPTVSYTGVGFGAAGSAGGGGGAAGAGGAGGGGGY